MKRVWPYNLLARAFNWKNEVVEFDEPKDFMMSLSYVMMDMKDEYANALLAYFRDGKRYRIIAIENGISITEAGKRVKHGLFIINSKYKTILLEGIHSYIKSLESDIIDLNHYIKLTPIEDLNLSPKTCNSLLRSEIYTVEDAKKAFETFSIVDMRGIGRHGIIEFAHAIGINDFSIDNYLKEKSGGLPVKYLGLPKRIVDELSDNGLNNAKAIREAFKDYSIFEMRCFNKKSIIKIAHAVGIDDSDINEYIKVFSINEEMKHIILAK